MLVLASIVFPELLTAFQAFSATGRKSGQRYDNSHQGETRQQFVSACQNVLRATQPDSVSLSYTCLHSDGLRRREHSALPSASITISTIAQAKQRRRTCPRNHDSHDYACPFAFAAKDRTYKRAIGRRWTSTGLSEGSLALARAEKKADHTDHPCIQRLKPTTDSTAFLRQRNCGLSSF
jgi:hypothetical protein